MHEHDDVLHEHPADRPERREGSEVDQLTQRALAGDGRGRLTPNQLTTLQRAAGNAGVAGLVEDDAADVVKSTISGPGSPLDRDTKDHMEQQIGADFSSVRVHSGPTAQRSTEAVAAKAYTVGENVVLGNSIDTGSESGQRTLAHELTHVVQQREGPVDGVDAGGVKVSDPSDRFEQEAETNADAVMAGTGPGVQRDADGGAAPAVQRQEKEEEMQMQRHADLQRQDEMEEDELQMQRQEMPEEEEELQMQRQEEQEEEEAMQMQRQEEEEEMQMQRQPEEEELMG